MPNRGGEECAAKRMRVVVKSAGCQTCGGHLGDVFGDGFLFPGTPAFVTGKRYCIDGAALVFVPTAQKGGAEGALEMVSGDLPPPNKRRPAFQG